MGLKNVGDKKNTQVYQDRGLARPDCSKGERENLSALLLRLVKRAGRDGEKRKRRERGRRGKRIIEGEREKKRGRQRGEERWA